MGLTSWFVVGLTNKEALSLLNFSRVSAEPVLDSEFL